MPEQDGGSGQGSGAGQGAGGNDQQQQNQGSPAAGTTKDVLGPDGKPLDPARAAAALERLRNLPDTVKEKETEIADLKAKLAEHESSKMTDSEKKERKISELEATNLSLTQQLQQLRVGTVLAQSAAKAGAIVPDAVVRMVDLATLKFDNDGAPVEPDKAIEAVRKAYPQLFNGRQGSADAGVRGHGQPQSFDDQIRQRAGR